MLPNPLPEIEQAISSLERTSLDAEVTGNLQLSSFLRGHKFIQVTGISKFWGDERRMSFSEHMRDFVISAHSCSSYLTLILAGNGDEVNIYFSLKDEQTTLSLLNAAFPGISLADLPMSDPEKIIHTTITQVGMASGIPSIKLNQDQEKNHQPIDVYRLERLIRGMRGTCWIYIVQAYPRSKADTSRDRQDLLSSMSKYGSLSKRQIQRSTQTSRVITKQDTGTVSEVLGGEIVDWYAGYAVDLMERELKRMDSSLATGRWQTAVYFGASTQPDLQRMASIVNGIFAGPDSRPDPIRTYLCQSGHREVSPEKFQTYLSSEELALFVQLPREEVPGYSITNYAEFDKQSGVLSGLGINLGKIEWDQITTTSQYSIPISDLAKHGAVFGVTGSGKTTTILGFLHQLWGDGRGVPFMVVEPAKTEYRALLGRVRGNVATGPIPDLNIYTLGNDVVAPFRLNPFEFELGETSGYVPVLSHIDFLKAVFNAAFILYAPMPYVLDTALHEIYEDKGWNLATGVNTRLPDQDWPNRRLYPIFPTLTDLYNKIEPVTVRFGYEKRIEQDVIAGLRARIGALRLGAKGLMFDVPWGIPISDLLERPTVLELESIGNDEEKTFIIGLLLARLYGYRRAQATQGRLPKGFQHILVIEEAHRLLKNVNTQVDTESANLRAQAIETFVNMLAEIRHYGQGVLVAEQIPSKLTPDVIKNTNLKIIHRLLAKDDRELVGTTMNMDENQLSHLTILRAGEAVVYAEGEDHPLLLRVDNYKDKLRLETPSEAEIKILMEKRISLAPYSLVPDFSSFGLRPAHFGGPDPLIYQAVLRSLSTSKNGLIWSRIILRAIFSRALLPDTIKNLRQQIATDGAQIPLARQDEALAMLVVMGASQCAESRGVENGWLFQASDNLRRALTSGLIKFIQLQDLKACSTDLDRFSRLYEALHKQAGGPYPGCNDCRTPCLYRSDVVRLLSNIERGHIRSVLAGTSYKSEEERYAALASLLKAIVSQWTGERENRADKQEIGYCTGLIAADSIGLDEYEQTSFGRRLYDQIFK
jgi:hypothetical protein